jgi:cytochrome c6
MRAKILRPSKRENNDCRVYSISILTSSLILFHNLNAMNNRIIMVVTVASFLSFTTIYHDARVSETGKNVFSTNCVRCHGVDGTKGKWGAKDLKQSKLTDPALASIIYTGKGLMPSWKNKLTQEEIDAVIDYVKTLRHSI